MSNSDHLQYTLFANSSTYGTPVVNALFFEFSDEPESFADDKQWLAGKDILVTLVLTPNVSTVDGKPAQTACGRRLTWVSFRHILW